MDLDEHEITLCLAERDRVTSSCYASCWGFVWAEIAWDGAGAGG